MMTTTEQKSINEAELRIMIANAEYTEETLKQARVQTQIMEHNLKVGLNQNQHVG